MHKRGEKMQKTKNYNLIKPDPADYYDVQQFNSNMDVIDQKLHEIVTNDNNVATISETTMPNSYDGRLLVNEIGGVCEQASTTGKNLLKNTAKSQTINGITFTVNSDGSVTANGTASSSTNADLAYAGTYGSTDAIIEKGKYVVSATGTSNIQLLFGYGNRQLGYVVNNDVEFNLDSDIAWVIVRVVAGVTLSNYTTYPMIRLASVTDATYEPYTGGVPSPNPSYPQEIKKTVVSEIRTHGKNFFNPNTHVTSSTTVAIVGGNKADSLDAELIKSGEYTISYNCDKNVSLFVVDYDKNNVIVNGTVKKSVTFTIPHDTRVNIWLYTSTGVNGIVDIQLEEGTVATSYEPYTESVITLSQPIELYGIGDVQDVIEGGKVKRRFAYQRVTGSDVKNVTLYADTGNSISINKNGKIDGKCMSNKFVGIKFEDRVKDVNSFRCYVDPTSYIMFRVAKSENNSFSSKDDAINFFNNNEVYVLYELAEEVIEDLPYTTQAYLNSLATYDGVTYLEFDSEVEPTFKVNYGISLSGGVALKSYCECEIAKLCIYNAGEKYKMTLQQGIAWFGHVDGEYVGQCRAGYMNHGEEKHPILDISTQGQPILLGANGWMYYAINPSRLPLTDDDYTEEHFFRGSMRVLDNIKVNNGVWSEETHVKKMGVAGGAAQPVEWVWNEQMQRWVLCTTS